MRYKYPNMWVSLKKPQTTNTRIPDRIKKMHFSAVDKKKALIKMRLTKHLIVQSTRLAE